ncbi:hypothetical protein Nepgr_022806 [Nepenthes gracilis]|uniref:Uncharacterized protein n=1 Tax=Nepenthes gracilis TaxID=150966 RepID=A0AAD3T1G7_NEPGR|nr:hypothetical protein Nepgr_022806 [Nepenthes gracilis]
MWRREREATGLYLQQAKELATAWSASDLQPEHGIIGTVTSKPANSSILQASGDIQQEEAKGVCSSSTSPSPASARIQPAGISGETKNEQGQKITSLAIPFTRSSRSLIACSRFLTPSVLRMQLVELVVCRQLPFHGVAFAGCLEHQLSPGCEL